ncbi:MAG TPA: hypothetical protein DDY86_09280 [Syntrophaceae bacterium]|nr:hypothetical protein [Syntrophaceae bacterium]
MAISLQRYGLTGKALTLPDNLKNRYSLLGRNAQSSTSAGITPSIAPDIGGPLPEPSGSNVSRSPNTIGGVPQGNIGEMEWSDIKGYAVPAALGLATGAVTAGPAGAVAGLVGGLRAGALGKAIGGVKKYGIDPLMDAFGVKDALGLGGLKKGLFSGSESTDGIVDAPSASADREAELNAGLGAWDAAGLPRSELVGEDAERADALSYDDPYSGIDIGKDTIMDGGWFSDDEKDRGGWGDDAGPSAGGYG